MIAFRATDLRLKGLAGKDQAARAKVAKLAVKAPDAGKAASLIGLPGSAASKLAPILEMTDAGKEAKALEELAGKLKVKLDGAAAVAKLKKAGF